METQVKIFVEEEKTCLISDPEIWKSRVAELGLEGQKKLVGAEGTNPIPFMRMDSRMQRVYETLCPTLSTLHDFSVEPIPTKVLDILSLCEKEHYFEKICVRYSNGAPDPIVVGYKNNEQYMIAQWSRELMAYAEAEKLAIARWIKQSRDQVKAKMAECEAFLKVVDEKATAHFTGGWVNVPY